jgi:hypothetical protein
MRKFIDLLVSGRLPETIFSIFHLLIIKYFAVQNSASSTKSYVYRNNVYDFKRLDYIDEEQISSIIQGKLISHFVIFQHILSCPKLCIANRGDQSTHVFFF